MCTICPEMLRESGTAGSGICDHNCKFGVYYHSHIVQCAQCARAQEAPPHWRPHHKANVKIVLELKCVETTTTKESRQFFTVKNCCPPKLCTLCPNEVNPAVFITSSCHCECVTLFVVTVCRLPVKQTRKWQSLANRHWKQFEL